MVIISLFLILSPTCPAMQMNRPWTMKHWCESVKRPEWPFAYSKYKGQIEESKGRVSTNEQDVRHVCDTRGVRSKCHICEDIVCKSPGQQDQLCNFQLQGVAWEDMSVNIPTVSDVPWAVNGSHRYDFGGSSTSHVCVYLSGQPPCQTSYGLNYSDCELRCWGYGSNMSGQNSSAKRFMEVPNAQWSNNDEEIHRGIITTPWEKSSPSIAWEYPKFEAGNEVPKKPFPTKKYSFNPQGFSFTLAGSNSGEAGFVDGFESEARFRLPQGVAVDHDGYVYVADTGNHAVRVISPLGRVQTLAGTGNPGYKDGLAKDGAQFSSPTDIAVWRDWKSWPYENPIDPDSFLYRNGDGAIVLFVADTDNHRIRKVSGDIVHDTVSGEKMWKNVIVECFSGICMSPTPEPGFADGTRETARFDSPQGVSVSHDGSVFVADTNNHLVREIDTSGTVRTRIGFIQSPFNDEFTEGSSIESYFTFPSDVALDPNETTAFVTDRHRIHMVDLRNNTITTIAGGKLSGERDGLGSEATLNNPASLAVTSDGVIYIVDSTSCRVRRVGREAHFIPQISCHDTLSSIMRPNGCTSYNIPLDDRGAALTPVEGNSHYNYQYRNRYLNDFGQDGVGKLVKNCVGSPPVSALDKKLWNVTTVSYPFNFNLVIDDGQTNVKEDPNDGSRITVSCRAGCSNNITFDDIVKTESSNMHVDYFYGEITSVCSAALNEGILNSSDGGFIDVTIVSEDVITEGGLNKSCAKGSRQYYIVTPSSQEARVQTISGAPASIHRDPCGYKDSFPAQESMFDYPSGISAFVNSSLDDAQYFIFVADRDNHVIRGMSAVCTFRCENGGRCIAPDKCECEEGWSGIDCTKPLCQLSCSYRELCVAPDTCACIPGFQGENCLDAKCAQKCQNGGYCSAPDTCTCLSGWFDPNCTTPVCRQTCGNGGNCTFPDTCSCPTEWTGFDCRQPVCDQFCSNGGRCVAPNTCLCPPSWSGYDCSKPVCHQGFFVPFHELSEERRTMPSYWNEYRPCNYSAWCIETHGFDCAQRKMTYSTSLPDFGRYWRFKTGRNLKPEKCMMIELQKNVISHFQYLSSVDNCSTPYFRYSPTMAYESDSQSRDSWTAFDRPQSGITQPYMYEIDRQVALASYTANVSQGVYMCANGGSCISPDVCSCEKGWVGFDCRVPICEQGYYDPALESFVGGVKTDQDFFTFRSHLDPLRSYNLDSTRNFSSNRDVSVMIERFINESFVERKLTSLNGSRYLKKDGQYQGGYECSIRSVTEWEGYRPHFVFEHPNYFSRYMNENVENNRNIYSYWKGMKFPTTHRKTERLIKYDNEYVLNNSSVKRSFVYTDVGYMIDGVWKVTKEQWEKGVCIVEFQRYCEGPFEIVNSRDIANDSVILVQDTDESFRPKIVFDDKQSFITGRLFHSQDEVCIDRVIRGCFNNGTCIAPNTCSCSTGWSGYDCSIPICDKKCLHNGNCTHPNTCTCERGWFGVDCSIPLCAQKCRNGGKCIAPDTCKCQQFPNEWRDARAGGGVPMFKKPNGDPQMTGWTGYDCSTPICVQAERFRLNFGKRSTDLLEIVPLGGKNHGITECNQERCTEYDEMLTQNDGKSFQSGCGWDVLETGCCFEIDIGAFTCFRCEKMEVGENSATCPHESFKTWHFNSLSVVPLSFRHNGDITMCGPSLNPTGHLTNSIDENNEVTTTSNMFLCNRWQWEQGDYNDDADMGGIRGVGADLGLKKGRHVRINFNNYRRSENDANTWVQGPEIQGEGIFECFNFGSCIEPDTCACRDGYGGFDCSTPLCRHQQLTGEIVGCQNGGICASKDDCHCLQTMSVLWKVHSEAVQGLTGWTGTDCSIPICIQGYYDPNCYASGGEGCYRCENGGFCISPDQCECAEGWSGYDCSIPICEVQVTHSIKKELMTTDENKIRIFEKDPCGMVGFSTLHGDEPRGMCFLPNQCKCLCKGSFDPHLCKKVGGAYCRTPFHDPLFRRRNVLPINQVFGTRDCFSGYEGVVDVNDTFGSCHLKIYEPSLFIRHTLALVLSIVVISLSVCLSVCCAWSRLKRKAKARRKDRQRMNLERKTNTSHALAYTVALKKKNN